MPVKTNYLQKRVEISQDVYEEILSDKKKDWRDILWNYPSILSRFLVKFQPISSILIYLLLTVLFLYNFPAVVNKLPRSTYKATAEKSKTTIVEGTLGNIVNLNPIFITRSQVDKDIQALVFQKFIRLDSNGNPRASIAQRWRVEGDKVYTFYMAEDIYFSDGQNLTAHDVKYTFDTAVYLSEKNQLNTIGAAMKGISIDVIDNYTVKFTLQEKNATIFEVISQYIVPMHYFGDSDINILESSWLNEKPVGSGPYKIAENKNFSITLVPSESFSPRPKIEKYQFIMYPTYEELLTAYYNNKLDIVSNIESNQKHFSEASVSFTQQDIELINRKRLIYFNTRDALKSVYARQALSHLVDKDRLIRELGLLAIPINGPIHKTSWAYNDDPALYYEYSPDKADQYLRSYGYTKDEESELYIDKEGNNIQFTLTYLDTSLNRKISREIEAQLREHGVILDIESGKKSYEQLIKEVIPNRDFELLLFEIETTIDPDQYDLWHSLKSDYPNLNLSGPTEKSQRIDRLLEMARMTTKINGENGRKEYYNLFQRYFMSDAPALFLYNPTYSFFVSDRVIIPESEYMAVPSDRFENIYLWEKII